MDFEQFVALLQVVAKPELRLSNLLAPGGFHASFTQAMITSPHSELCNEVHNYFTSVHFMV